MFRALAWLRLVVLLNAVGLYAFRQVGYDRPLLGWVVMGALAAWTAYVVWACHREHTRRTWVFVVDLLVALSAMGLSQWIKGDDFRATLPGFWISGVLLAWAIRWRLRGGIAAGTALVTCDLLIRTHLTQTTYANIFLLLLGGATVGFLSELMQRLALERDEAVLSAASAAERQRLARVVHDGVLQVLALVQREGGELASLAGRVEARLRALVQNGEPPPPVTGTADLAPLLAALTTEHVHVSTPGTPVLMAPARADELLAVVEACLSNVRHHVGREAPAWVLLEEVGDDVVVSVRDNGPGIAPGRLQQASDQGRLGVAQSIRGRIDDLDGRAVLSTSAAGTEWEFVVPR